MPSAYIRDPDFVFETWLVGLLEVLRNSVSHIISALTARAADRAAGRAEANALPPPAVAPPLG